MFINGLENNTKLYLILWDGSVRELVRCFPDRKTDHLEAGIMHKKLFRTNGQLLICLKVDRSRHNRPVLKDWLDRAGEYIYLLDRVHGFGQLQMEDDNVGNDIGCFRLPEVLSTTYPFPASGLLTEIAPHVPEDCPLPFRGEVFRFDSRSLFCIYDRQVPEPARYAVKDAHNCWSQLFALHSREMMEFNALVGSKWIRTLAIVPRNLPPSPLLGAHVNKQPL